ncbi:amidohydrolase family protein [Actinomycetospora soli]|uniref:amidohydrolase family protein n=1 Tax=Actinomycetospora soli TaxID=2893887 RepID=UPI001E285A13|nr:amidohydrolase family protein [Actinomycetospora soli]MCD2189347.1 amidohydrolase family protein [Actinomycetospora soli]
MPADLVIRARRAVLPGGTAPAVVTVSAGRITTVAPYEAPVDGPLVELADDEVLLPGLVDTSVCVDDLATVTAAAAAGGVTTLVAVDAPGDGPVVDLARWGAVADPDRMRTAAQEGVRGFVGTLTDAGDGSPPLSHDELVRAATTCAELGLPLLVHAEDDGVLSEAPPAGPDLRSYLASRPPGAETTAVLRLGAVAARTGAHVHVRRLSAFEAAEEVGALRDTGVPLTAETCPHHLALAAETLPGPVAACRPPVRSESNRELLWGALGAGRLDAVVADHAPLPAAAKRGGYDEARPGIASLEVALRVLWSAAAARGHTLDDVAAWTAAAPARLAGLDAKGAIAVGRDADLVVFAPDEIAEVDPADLHEPHTATPYAGMALQGAVRRVWVRGEAPAVGRRL